MASIPANNAPPGVYGMKDVADKLKKVPTKIGPKIRLGLLTAGLHLQRTSQLMVPVDFGILKASAYTRAQGQGAKTLVHIGYTAFYAMFVHELVEMKLKGLPRGPIRFKDDVDMIENLEKQYAPRGNYWDPAGRGQAKFLEAPARDQKVRTEMFNIVKNVTGFKVEPGEGGVGGMT